jgi:hypothetical protein
MPVFIAKDYEGTPIDVILTANEKLANAYWHGKGIVPHSITIRSDADLQGHPTGVLPIVSTEEIEVRPNGLSSRLMRFVCTP